jgi:peptide/nickel transport system substrate-binding protein
MTRGPKAVLVACLALQGALVAALPAVAQTRAETLRQITGATINTLDPTLPGSTREAFGLSMSTYDRLVTFGRKKVGNGYIFDYGTIRGELAESYEVSPDGLKITFHLRKDAKFHDGSPVTAEDVKWSLDRDVAAKSLAAPQLLTGSLTKPEQFSIVDPYTVQVTLDKPDRLALPNLATVYAIIINSKLAKQHATPEDPWAQGWLKEHEAGGGAYIVDSWKPGEQAVLRRFEDWKSGADGKLPFFKRVIAQTIPEAATRANLVERGDADLSIDLQASDVQSLESRGKVKIVSTPQFNAFTLIAFNTKMPPFDNVKVRQAIAAALPYEDMFKAALFGRGVPLYGASWTDMPPTAAFPQKMPLATDLDKARKLLTEAGFPEGFETTFSFNVGSAQVNEPLSALIKESLGKVGVKVEIQKMPDAQISTMISEKKLPFLTENSVAWLPSPDYLFRNFFTGDQRWNYSSWDNKEVVDLAQAARFERDQAKYDEDVKKLIAIDAREVPEIMIWQANQDAVMVPSLDGYTYWFHRQVDFRDLSRG